MATKSKITSLVHSRLRTNLGHANLKNVEYQHALIRLEKSELELFKLHKPAWRNPGTILGWMVAASTIAIGVASFVLQSTAGKIEADRVALATEKLEWELQQSTDSIAGFHDEMSRTARRHLSSTEITLGHARRTLNEIDELYEKNYHHRILNKANADNKFNSMPPTYTIDELRLANIAIQIKQKYESAARYISKADESARNSERWTDGIADLNEFISDDIQSKYVSTPPTSFDIAKINDDISTLRKHLIQQTKILQSIGVSMGNNPVVTTKPN